jgi:hypothetical protein
MMQIGELNVGNFLKGRVIRVSPLIAFAIFILLIGPERMGRLPGWARWAMAAYVFLAIIVPALLGSRSKKASPLPNSAGIQKWARRFWISMLVTNIGAFIIGVAMILALHNVIRVRYAILAPCVNLLLIVLFSWILYSTNKPRGPQ